MVSIRHFYWLKKIKYKKINFYIWTVFLNRTIVFLAPPQKQFNWTGSPCEPIHAKSGRLLLDVSSRIFSALREKRSTLREKQYERLLPGKPKIGAFYQNMPLIINSFLFFSLHNMHKSSPAHRSIIIFFPLLSVSRISQHV